jgi:hypothetical protein
VRLVGGSKEAEVELRKAEELESGVVIKCESEAKKMMGKLLVLL